MSRIAPQWFVQKTVVGPFFKSMLLAAAVSGLVACGPQATTGQNTGTPTPAPTPTPSPVPVLDVDYRLTTMTVAENKADYTDVDGDGGGDNGLPAALKEMGSFLNSRIKAQLKESYDAGDITEEQYRALTASMTAAITAIFNVETINKALGQAMTQTPWLQEITTTSAPNLTVQFWLGEGHEAGYLTTTSLGILDGTYSPNVLEVAAKGGPFQVNLVVSAGGEAVTFEIDLDDCKTIETYVKGQPLQNAKMGGGVGIASLEDFVNEVLTKLGLLPFFDKQSLQELQDDLNDLLKDIADIKLQSGEDAISVSLTYDGSIAEIYGPATTE